MVRIMTLFSFLVSSGCAALGKSIFNWHKSRERAKAQVTERKIEIGEHEIAYLEGGEGPTLLLLHGFGAHKDTWTRFAAEVVKEFHVVIPDLPGHGLSTRLMSESYDIESQLERLKAFHTALELDVVHLLGNSMGGQLAVAYAISHPRDVATMTLFTAGGVREPKHSKWRQEAAKGKNILVPSTAEAYEALLDALFVERPYVPGPVMTYFAEETVKHAEFTKKIWADLSRRPFLLDEKLVEVNTPTLIVWGDTDLIIDPSAAQVLADGIAGSELVMLKDCGHVPMLERPEESAQVFRTFIARVPASL
jgi:abhydrolase domain-containing protein 6